jgi:predicted heme/steroid binding protein
LTGNLLFGLHESPYLNPRTYLGTPRPNLAFTPEELRRYDGSDPKLPLYLALNGSVYDVSANRRTYGPGGSYHHFAGVDAARAYATGCMRTHLTYDLRGLTDEQLLKIKGWHHFYDQHKVYYRVGHVLNPEIDPSTPIPEDCKKQPAQTEG